MPAPPAHETEPFASRYPALPSERTLLRGATVLTGTGERLEDADVLLGDGKIVAVGTGLEADGATVVNATGKWVTPGIIDIHSHLGVYPSPGTESHSDGNEATAPGDRRSLGRTQRLAARSRLRHGDGGRHHVAAGAAGFRQPRWRSRRHV